MNVPAYPGFDLNFLRKEASMWLITLRRNYARFVYHEAPRLFAPFE